MAERDPYDNTIALFAARYAMNRSGPDAERCVTALDILAPTLSDQVRQQIVREAKEDIQAASGAWPEEQAFWQALIEKWRQASPGREARWSAKHVAEAEEAILLGALQYALPRMSTASSIVSSRMLQRWDDLSPELHRRVGGLIDVALQEGRAGQACDRALWRKVQQRAWVSPGRASAEPDGLSL